MFFICFFFVQLLQILWLYIKIRQNLIDFLSLSWNFCLTFKSTDSVKVLDHNINNSWHVLEVDKKVMFFLVTIIITLLKLIRWQHFKTKTKKFKTFYCFKLHWHNYYLCHGRQSPLRYYRTVLADYDCYLSLLRCHRANHLLEDLLRAHN